MLKDKTKARAFTLVELLVVISIIALLLAILMPSLNKARAKGREIVCKTNLHSLLQASMLYSQDNKDLIHPIGFLVSLGDVKTAAQEKGWYEIMLPYYPVKKSFWKCPADATKALKRTYKVNRSVSVNYYTANKSSKIKENFGPGDKKSQKINRPTDTIMYTCIQYNGPMVSAAAADAYETSNVGWGGTYDYVSVPAGAKGTYSRPHSKTDDLSLYGMLDGRAISTTYQKKDTATGFKYLEGGAKWAWDTETDRNIPWR